MLKVIHAERRMEAWMHAAKYMREGNKDANIVLDISNPLREKPEDVALSDWLDDFYKSKDTPEKPVHSLHTVAEYIFPGWEYRHHGFEGVFENYPAAYELMRKAAPNRWGTYAYRMMRVQLPNGTLATDKNGGPLNPLAHVLRRMKRVISGEGASAYVCYELNTWHPWRDTNTRSLPCLTHVSLKLLDGKVHLNAMYRNHDYAYKVPGNLLGLARLQSAISEHVGATVGNLVVHSTRAYYEESFGALGDLYEKIDSHVLSTPCQESLDV